MLNVKQPNWKISIIKDINQGQTVIRIILAMSVTTVQELKLV